MSCVDDLLVHMSSFETPEPTATPTAEPTTIPPTTEPTLVPTAPTGVPTTTPTETPTPPFPGSGSRSAVAQFACACVFLRLGCGTTACDVASWTAGAVTDLTESNGLFCFCYPVREVQCPRTGRAACSYFLAQFNSTRESSSWTFRVCPSLGYRVRYAFVLQVIISSIFALSSFPPLICMHICMCTCMCLINLTSVAFV